VIPPAQPPAPQPVQPTEPTPPAQQLFDLLVPQQPAQEGGNADPLGGLFNQLGF